VLHNFELYEPVSSPRRAYYGELIRRVFHERKICDRPAEECAAGRCALDVGELPRTWNVYHDIDNISRSRTGAYYFLNDNRRELEIPPDQDVVVVDLYDTNKFGRSAHRLPREIVVEYVWREEFELDEPRFGHLRGQTAELLCGGTLVLDGRGNVLSWFHKPGTQLEKNRPEGLERLERLRDHLARQSGRGRIGLRGESEVEVFGHWTPPIVADTQSGALRLEIAPHLRNTVYAEHKASEREQADPENPVWRWGGDEWSMSF
jgi:hypothetical protein